jgi:hypothetical protein
MPRENPSRSLKFTHAMFSLARCVHITCRAALVMKTPIYDSSPFTQPGRGHDGGSAPPARYSRREGMLVGDGYVRGLVMLYWLPSGISGTGAPPKHPTFNLTQFSMKVPTVYGVATSPDNQPVMLVKRPSV